MDTTINELITVENKIKTVKRPEDLFGDEKTAEKNFRRLARMVHEDFYPDELKPRAHAAFLAVVTFWKVAETRIKNGTYGTELVSPKSEEDSGPATFRTKKYLYTAGRRIYAGGTCGIFEGIIERRDKTMAPVIFRVPHSFADNDLMEREARAFISFKDRTKPVLADPDGQKTAERLLSRFPFFLESALIQEPGTMGEKVINTFAVRSGLETGWYTLEAIRKAYPDGVGARVAVFIWNRILEALIFAHLSGIVHGAVTPNHVLVHAETHAGNLIDWTASCDFKNGEKIPYNDDRFISFLPPEVLAKEVPAPSSDIYMSAWCAVYLLGGDPAKKMIPANVPKQIAVFLNRCLQPKQRLRPQNAEVVLKEFQQISKDLYGPKKFVELAMPQ